MATLLWPCGVLKPQNVAFDIAPRTLAAPASVSGFTQVVATDAGIWKATFDQVIVRSRDAVLTFRAISARLEGRLHPVLVPLCSAYQPVPDGAAGAGIHKPVPHSDKALFSDGAGYRNGLIDITVTAAAPARAIGIKVRIDVAGRIQGGQHFSVGDRLYRVTDVQYTSSTTANLLFRPPLREAVPAGAHLEFDDPVCRMRLATDSEMDLELALHRFGSPTVNFLEDL